MFLKVDPSAAIPVYVQIMDHVKHSIASGLLRNGDRLPSIRDLARELRVNPNTVVKAYRELEIEGVIESRKGQGSYVSATSGLMSLANRRKILSEIVDRMLVEAYHLSLNDERVIEIVRERMGARPTLPRGGIGGSDEQEES